MMTNDVPEQPLPEQGHEGLQPPSTTMYGGVWKRFGARIIDGLIVGIPVAILLAVLPGLGTGGLIGTALSALAGFAYFVFMETSSGATLGKRLLGMSVVGVGGESPISADASARRNAWMLLGLLGGVPLLGLLASLASLGIAIAIAVTISSDNRNQGLHDKFGSTLVVERG